MPTETREVIEIDYAAKPASQVPWHRSDWDWSLVLGGVIVAVLTAMSLERSSASPLVWFDAGFLAIPFALPLSWRGLQKRWSFQFLGMIWSAYGVLRVTLNWVGLFNASRYSMAIALCLLIGGIFVAAIATFWPKDSGPA